MFTTFFDMRVKCVVDGSINGINSSNLIIDFFKQCISEVLYACGSLLNECLYTCIKRINLVINITCQIVIELVDGYVSLSDGCVEIITEIVQRSVYGFEKFLTERFLAIFDFFDSFRYNNLNTTLCL